MIRNAASRQERRGWGLPTAAVIRSLLQRSVLHTHTVLFWITCT